MKRLQILSISLLLLGCLLPYKSNAQEIFEDVGYEPASIEYEGTHNSSIDNMAARAFVAIKNYHSKSAQETFDSILVMDKHNVLASYGLAYCKFADGDYENAIELLTPLLNINNKNAGLYSLRGRCNMVLENLPNAIDDFKKAVELGKNENDILSLSQCLFYSGDFNGAVIQSDSYIAKQATNYQGYFVQGLAKAGLKEYDIALTQLDKAMDLSAKNSGLFYQVTKVLVEMKELNKAVKTINRAIKFDVENADATELRAEIKYELHDYTNAIFDCNRVIELGGATAVTYLTRAKANIKLGLNKGACADLTKAQQMGNKEAIELLAKNCK